MSSNQAPKDEMREMLRTMRKEVQKITKDLTKATQTVVGASKKTYRDVSPKVASTVDDTMKETSIAFHRAMAGVDKQTKQQQVRFLRSYKSFLSKQVDLIEKRLRKIQTDGRPLTEGMYG